LKQEEIHELLLSFAVSGATVLRLKGGDPLVSTFDTCKACDLFFMYHPVKEPEGLLCFTNTLQVFGRGGEEMDFLQEKGIQVQVVPGMSHAMSSTGSEYILPVFFL